MNVKKKKKKAARPDPIVGRPECADPKCSLLVRAYRYRSGNVRMDRWCYRHTERVHRHRSAPVFPRGRPPGSARAVASKPRPRPDAAVAIPPHVRTAVASVNNGQMTVLEATRSAKITTEQFHAFARAIAKEASRGKKG